MVYAGTAVSSTKLLVGKEASSTSTPGLVLVKQLKPGSSASSSFMTFDNLDWTNVTQFEFRISGVTFNGSSRSSGVPYVQFKAGGNWSSWNMESCVWVQGWSGSSESYVSINSSSWRVHGNESLNVWTGTFIMSANNGIYANNETSNTNVWGETFGNDYHSRFRGRASNSNFRQNDISGVRFSNTSNYSMGYDGQITMYKWVTA